MVIDTSAIMAIFFDEPEREQFVSLILQSEHRLVSAMTVTESGLVAAGRYGPEGLLEMRRLTASLDMLVAPIDEVLAQAAADAFIVYGKGRHPARLNLGDCFSYALAKAVSQPLLFKGDDFSLTDIKPAG